MASTTQLAAAQDALLVLLKAASGLTGVTVELAPVGTLKAEHVWIPGDVPAWQDAPDMTAINGGAQVREEIFTIPVKLVVTKSTNDYKTVRDRAITLIQAIEGVVAVNPTISGTVMQANIGAKRLSDGWADQQRQVAAEMDVECLAMLA
jgi:hypothetical protein